MKYKLSILLITLTSSLLGNNFNYAEINTFFQNNDYTVGFREYLNKDKHQIITRYDFNPFRVEYRYVTNNQLNENWFRFQYTQFKKDGYSYKHRFEHRDRESKLNILRYRPRAGYSFSEQVLGGSPFVVFEPHFQYTYDNKSTKFSHMQTFIGLKYKLKQIIIAPFLEIDTDRYFEHDTSFLGVDVKYKF